MSTRILRLPAVLAESGYSRSTIYLLISQGLWPKPVRMGARVMGWPDIEVQALIVARIASKSEEAIRVLVKRLEAARKDAE